MLCRTALLFFAYIILERMNHALFAPHDVSKEKGDAMEQLGLYVGILGGVLGAAGVVVSMVLGISYHRRLKNQELAEDVSTETTLKVDIDYIKRGVDDIKSEQRRMYEDYSRLNERVIRVEESVKSAHQRLDQHLGIKAVDAPSDPCKKDEDTDTK